MNPDATNEFAFAFHGWINIDQAIYVEELREKHGLTNVEIIRQLLDDHQKSGGTLQPQA